MDPNGPCSSFYNPNEVLGINVLQSAIMCYSSCVMGNGPVHVREKGDCYEALIDRASLQLADEGIRFRHGWPKCLWDYCSAIVLSRHDDRRGVTCSHPAKHLPSSWETFVTTICNNPSTAMTYASATRAILSEDARGKLVEQNTSGEAYVVQEIGDRHHGSQSSS